MTTQQWLRNRLQVLVIAALFCGVGRLAAFAEDAVASIDYARDVLPVLSSKCFRCHGPDAAQRKGDLRLDKAEAVHGTVVTPGQPAESALISRVFESDPDLKMPPPASNVKLTVAEQELLVQWVSEGAR